MKKLTLPLAGAAMGSIATAVAYLAFGELCITVAGGAGVIVALTLLGRPAFLRRQVADGRTIGVGTVRKIGSEAGNHPAPHFHRGGGRVGRDVHRQIGAL